MAKQIQVGRRLKSCMTLDMMNRCRILERKVLAAGLTYKKTNRLCLNLVIVLGDEMLNLV